MHTYECAHLRANAHIHTDTYTRIHTPRHACTHARTHTYTHMHAHALHAQARTRTQGENLEPSGCARTRADTAAHEEGAAKRRCTGAEQLQGVS